MTDKPELEQQILVKMETLLKRYEKMEKLLRQAYPYVRGHWERSRTGFGSSAQILMNEISALLGIK